MNEYVQIALLQKAIDETGVGVVLTNPKLPENPIIYANKGFVELTGYAIDEVIGRNCRFLQGTDTRQADVQRIRDAIEAQQSCEVEILNYKKNGDSFWNELHLTPIFNDKGELEYFIGIQKDVTARKQAEEARVLYEKVFQNTQQAVMITDQNSTILLVNEAFSNITGYSFKDVIGKKPTMLSSGKHQAPFYKKLWDDILNKGQWEGELWNKRKNGEIYPEFLNISAIRNSYGNVTNYVAIFTDITDSKNREMQFAKMSLHDSLTGIGNRRAFDRYLQEKWEILSEIQEPISLILLDIDYFKQYNDNYGHIAGDIALIKVAKAIEGSIELDMAMATRYGGEEFAIVLPQISAEKAYELANKICSQIEQLKIEHRYSPIKEVISVSCGVSSLIPSKENDKKQLIGFADEALYEAKKAGRDGVVVCQNESE